MDTLDRWALHQLAELVRHCGAAYDAYEFHKVYQLCNQFCAVTLSATYHDILKDRLYTLGSNNPLRRYSQTALHHCFHTLTRLLAPILVFTTDEAWSFAVAQTEYTDGSVHLEDWPVPAADWTNSGIEQDVAVLLQVRAQVNGTIEPLRAAGKLGKSLDAAVTITAPAPRSLPGPRETSRLPAELFIASHVSLTEAAGAPAMSIHVRPCPKSATCAVRAAGDGCPPRS